MEATIPYNGSGTFTRVHSWTTDKANAINVNASRMDEECDGYATGLSTCITKDGQTTVTANLPMATFKHTGVGNAAARDQYTSVASLQDSGHVYAAAAGSAGAYTLTLAPAITVYAAGQHFQFKANHDATAAPTLAVNGLAATALQWGTTALAAYEIQTNDLVDVVFSATGPSLQVIGISRPSGWTVLAKATAAGASSIDLENGIGAGFSRYAIDLINLVPSTDGDNLGLRVKDTTYQADATDYAWHVARPNAGANTYSGANSASDDFCRIADDVGNDTGEAYNGVIEFYEPSGTSKYKMIRGDGVSAPSGGVGALRMQRTAGVYQGTNANAITGIRIAFEASNITGTAVLRGLRK